MQKNVIKKLKRYSVIGIVMVVAIIVLAVLMFCFFMKSYNIQALLCAAGMALLGILQVLLFNDGYASIYRAEIQRIESLSVEEKLREFGLHISIKNDEKGNDIDRLLNGEELEVYNDEYDFKGKILRVSLR